MQNHIIILVVFYKRTLYKFYWVNIMPFIYRREDVKNGIEYIKRDIIPKKITDFRDVNNFKRKWEGVKYVNNKFMKGDKEIILKEDIGVFLIQIYNNPEYGYVGRDKLFAKVKEKYLNISQRDINSFLKNHETNQVHQPIIKVVASRPVRTKKANSVWYADLIIINKKKEDNNQPNELDKVILTVIDAFSKYAWARVIEGTKDSKTVAREMDIIFSEESPNLPKVLHTDNGGEFKAEFKDLLKKYKITHRLSRPNQPSDASLIERWNRTIKTMWAKYTTQTGDNSLSKLPELVHNYNTNVHSSTKKRPMDLHPNKGNGEVDKKDIRIARRQINNRIKKSVAQQKALYPDEIKVGDYVRIDHKIDEKIKDNIFRKKFLRQWSFRLYKVINISRPSKYKNSFYTLQFESGEQIFPTRRFYRHELLKVDKNKLVRALNTMAEASRTLDHNPNDMFDFFHEGFKVIDAQKYKTRKVKTNPHGWVWELSFEGIPNKQFVHPDRVEKAGKYDEFNRLYNKEEYEMREYIGRRFKSYWPTYKRWFTGTIEDYNPVSKKHKLVFDLTPERRQQKLPQIVEWDNLKTTKFKWKFIK